MFFVRLKLWEWRGDEAGLGPDLLKTIYPSWLLEEAANQGSGWSTWRIWLEHALCYDVPRAIVREVEKELAWNLRPVWRTAV